jgi:DNA-binding protein HU-beta
MNKSELLDAIVKQTGDTKAAALKHLDATTAAIVAAVKKGDNVTMVGFGTFKLVKRAARVGKNPKTGEALKIAANTVPRFTAGAGFKAAVGKVKAKK